MMIYILIILLLSISVNSYPEPKAEDHFEIPIYGAPLSLLKVPKVFIFGKPYVWFHDSYFTLQSTCMQSTLYTGNSNFVGGGRIYATSTIKLHDSFSMEVRGHFTGVFISAYSIEKAHSTLCLSSPIDPNDLFKDLMDGEVYRIAPIISFWVSDVGSGVENVMHDAQTGELRLGIRDSSKYVKGTDKRFVLHSLDTFDKFAAGWTTARPVVFKTFYKGIESTEAFVRFDIGVGQTFLPQFVFDQVVGGLKPYLRHVLETSVEMHLPYDVQGLIDSFVGDRDGPLYFPCSKSHHLTHLEFNSVIILPRWLFDEMPSDSSTCVLHISPKTGSDYKNVTVLGGHLSKRFYMTVDFADLTMPILILSQRIGPLGDSPHECVIC